MPDHARRPGWPLLAGLATGGVLVVAVLGAVLAITGADVACHATAPSASQSPPSAVARDEIPAVRLRLYRAAGRRFGLDWTFLAAIGAQECHHGSCAGDNGSGCAGPMQIAVRRRSPCSPGAGPTLWERFKVDADRDGHAVVNDPTDAIFTAARILRSAKGAPTTGGSYGEYRQAACRYYGACADAASSYADEVMARAVRYGFHGTDASGAEPVAVLGPTDGCSVMARTDGQARFGEVFRATAPRESALLPAAVTAGARIACDARIVDDVVWLAQRYAVMVTACLAIHAHGGEHPLGAATDLVPAAGRNWQDTTERLARDSGWGPGCAASGVAPACAGPPFRFIAYNGYPAHGDPAHCHPCGGGPHLHLSWLTSASTGQPEHQPRAAYFAPSWIDVFDPAAEG